MRYAPDAGVGIARVGRWYRRWDDRLGDPRNVGRKTDGRGSGPTDKQPVVSLVHYETRAAHARVVADVTGKSLLPAIEEMMDVKRTHLHIAGGPGYKHIASQFARHEWVDHKGGEYARGNVSTNLNEGFHSQLKRSLDGTHHHVSPGSTPTAS